MRYVSDIITEKELAKWEMGDKILIQAGTGSGKNYFFGNRIYEYCKRNNYKALILSNRTALKNQNSQMLFGKMDYVNYCNYQAVENTIRKNDSTAMDIFRQYDIVAFDESQYFYVDSTFNNSTNLVLEYCATQQDNQIMIFMSATPQVMLEHLPKEKFSYIYKLKTDYSYIKEIVFYKDEDDVDGIIDAIPPDEKAIYFANDGIDSYTLAIKNNNKNYKFICSRYNASLKKKSDKQTYDEIVQTEKFNCKVLATTKVLDNGINLKDEKLKHILIDIHEPISLVQCFGRKRKIQGADNSVTLYVRVPNQQIILISKTNYSRGADSDSKNIAQVVFSRYMNRCYGDMLKVGYRQYVCDLFDFPLENSTEYNMDKEQVALASILENYIGMKMFDEVQQDFKENFGQGIFNTKNPNYKRRGFKSLQAIIEEDGLPYELTRGRDRTNGRDKWYWLIVRKDGCGEETKILPEQTVTIPDYAGEMDN